MADLNNDIKKYLKGELTPAEMHALEKKALHDPFLEEALEGAGQIPTDELDADMAALHRSLDQRLNKGSGKTVSMWVWPMRIAAGLLLVAVSTFIIMQLTGDEPSTDLALKKESTAPANTESQPPVAADTTQVADEGPAVTPRAKTPAPQPAAADDVSTATENTVPPEASLEQEVAPAAPAVADIKPAEDLAAPEVAEEKIAAAESRAEPLKKREAKRSSDVSKSKEKAQGEAAAGARPLDGFADTSPSRIVRGTVSSEDGAGLPGVNVMIKGSNLGTVTDAMGNYQIPVTDENPNLLFSFIGYTNTEISVAGKEQADVQLAEDISQLSEVVVVGYGEKGVGETTTPPLELAEPAGGRKAFKQYLEKNIRYPQEALTNNVEGKVTIMFTVETSGALSDFRVIRGIGYGCDDEVIRLIKEGPKWTPSKRNEDAVRDKVKVRMRFKLPENKK